MQIECILKRKDGTKAEISGTEYHFAPNKEGAHVAEVTDPAHIQRFLSITEGYRIYGEVPKGAAKKGGKKPETVLLGSSVHEMAYTIGDKTYALGDVVALAHEKSNLSVEDWNALSEEDRHARIDMALDDLAEAAEGK